MTKLNILLGAGLFAGALFGAAAPAPNVPPPPVFTCALDHTNAVYALGETMTFALEARAAAGAPALAGTVTATLDDWCGHELARREVDLAKTPRFTLAATPREPGFVRLRVKGAGLAKPFLRGAACAPERIRPAGKCPDDFDAFWRDARAKLAREVPLDPRVEPDAERSKGRFTFYRVSFATCGNRRVWGFLTVPKKPAVTPLPAYVEVASAGRGNWTADFRGGRADAIVLYFTVHAHEPPKDLAKLGALYDDLERTLKAKYGTRSYSSAGVAVSREETYFYPVILGIDRAVDWLWARPDVDRTRFHYCGGSQGGGFGWYLTGLNKKFVSAVLRVPAMSDLQGHLIGRSAIFPYMLEQNGGSRYAAACANAPYFDGANFAPRITCPIRVSVGFIDEICPPTNIYATYNRLGSTDKAMIHGIVNGHGSWPAAAAADAWQEKLNVCACTTGADMR